MDTIINILGTTGGSWGVVTTLLLLAFFLVYRVTKAITEWDVKLKMSESNVNSMKSDINNIKQDVMFIKTRLDIFINTPNNPSSLTQSHSPIGLSPKGVEVADKMGIKLLINNNWSKIESYLTIQENLKNAYDIQQFCIEIATVSLERFFTAEDVDKIKLFAFNEGVNLGYYGSMIGVLIRDRYFEVKGINVDDVDKHSPKI